MPLLKHPSSSRRPPFNFFDVRFHSREQARVVPVKNTFLARRGIGGFSVGRTRESTYDDRVLGVTNPIMATHVKEPHLVLFDVSKVPRVVLSYVAPRRGEVQITAVQRLRNEYLPYFSYRGENRWSSTNENRVARAHKEALGAHPSDVLVSEFLYRFRQRIRSGKTVVTLKVPEGEMRLYKVIIKRFFSEKPVPGTKDVFALSMEKKRTKEALALK